jgi:hypothetical protein
MFTHPGVPLGDGDEPGLRSGAGVGLTAERVPLADGDADAGEDVTGLPVAPGLRLSCRCGLVCVLGN